MSTPWKWPLAFASALLVVGFAHAQAPRTINYQGFLTSSGNPPVPVNGNQVLTFRIYDHATSTAPANLLWFDTQLSVPVVNGVFNAILGLPFPQNPFPPTLVFDKPYFLAVVVGSDSEMTPRQPLQMSPYAYRAVVADSVSTAIPGGQVTGAILQGGNAFGTTETLGTTDNNAVRIISNGTRALQVQSVSGGLTNSLNVVNVLGGSPLNTIAPGVVAATIVGGGGTTSVDSPNVVTGDYGSIVGGIRHTAGAQAFVGGGNTNIASGSFSTIGGGVGNTASGQVASILGGQNNVASEVLASVAGGQLNVASGTASFVGGGFMNQATGIEATVGGGTGNHASAALAAIGGGQQNVASAQLATIGGGYANQATGDQSTIGGGDSNVASGTWSTIGGGVTNAASGTFSTVPGGAFNQASGDYSFAAGRGALTHVTIASPFAGTFVWADSFGNAANAPSFSAVIQDEFAARARGGFRFVTDADAGGAPTRTVSIKPNAVLDFGANLRQMISLFNNGLSAIGVQTGTQYYRSVNNFAWYNDGVEATAAFDPGAGGTVLMTLSPAANPVPGAAVTGHLRAQTITQTSDRAAKTAFEKISARDILARVVGLPIAAWSYRNEGAIRHIGPVAQDFRAAFNLGYDDKTIATVDSEGVALAAIQGLHQLVEEKDARINQQESRIRQLEAALAAIQSRLALRP